MTWKGCGQKKIRSAMGISSFSSGEACNNTDTFSLKKILLELVKDNGFSRLSPVKLKSCLRKTMRSFMKV